MHLDPDQGQDQDQDQGQEVVQTRDVEEDVLVPGEEVGEDQEVLHLEVDVDLEAALLEEGVVLEVHHQNVVNDHQHQNDQTHLEPPQWVTAATKC